MTDATDRAGGNAHEFTVSELSGSLKRAVEDQFGHVRVRGELSGVKRAASGHLYLALKDDNSVLDGVCWRGTAQRLSFRPEDGLEVICTGKLTTYGARSKYQMVIERMEPAGVGALMALLEDRKKKLAAEGLFAPERKQPLPFLPQVIGVVTSPTGAVIRDILHRLSDRFPRHVLLWPVLVQGDGAADQIAAAIRGFNAMPLDGDSQRPDLLIVARGGGSLEDLWSFNEEVVVRAAAESAIPLISAVGHETDTTLIDYASDRRAPTPTGAAEMAVPVRADLLATIADLNRRLEGQTLRMIDDRRERLDALARALPKPSDLMGLKAQRLDDLAERLGRSLTQHLDSRAADLARLGASLRPSQLDAAHRQARDRAEARASRLDPAFKVTVERADAALMARSRLLDSLSYERVLDRGFALVTDPEGTPVTNATTAGAAERLDLTFADGAIAVVPVNTESNTALAEHKRDNPAPKTARTTVKKKPTAKAPAEGQGSLF